MLHGRRNIPNAYTSTSGQSAPHRQQSAHPQSSVPHLQKEHSEDRSGREGLALLLQREETLLLDRIQWHEDLLHPGQSARWRDIWRRNAFGGQKHCLLR